MKTTPWMEALTTLIELQKGILATLEREAQREKDSVEDTEPEEERRPVQRTL